MAFLVFSAGMPLQVMVDDAFVTGVKAPITPMGLAIFISPLALFSSIIPVVLRPLSSFSVPGFSSGAC